MRREARVSLSQVTMYRECDWRGVAHVTCLAACDWSVDLHVQ